MFGFPTLYDQQARNKRVTVLLFAIYIALFILAGQGIDLAMTRRFGGGLVFSVFTIPIMIIMCSHAIWKIVRAIMVRWGWWSPENQLVPAMVLLVGSLPVLLMFYPFVFGLFDHYAGLSGYPTAAPAVPVSPPPSPGGYAEYWLHGRFQTAEPPPSGFQIALTRKTTLYLPLGIGTLLGLAVGIVSAVWAYFKGAGAIATLSDLATPDIWNFRHRQLVNVAEEMSLAAGVPPPTLYILDDKDPNAFAIGTSPKRSSIVVTTGLLEQLDREELQAVVAHEVGHIRNLDVRVMTLVSVFFGSVRFLTGLTRRGWFLGAAPKKAILMAVMGGILGILLRGVWLFNLLLAPLAAKLVAMAVSRNREYLADLAGAELTRNPLALVKALQKLERAFAPTLSVQRGLEHLCIIDPMARPLNQQEGFWAELFATHPPTEKRLTYLRAMAHS